MKEVSKEDYLKAIEVIQKYNKQQETKIKEVENICTHEWVRKEDWGGQIENNTYCIKCKMDNPSNN